MAAVYDRSVYHTNAFENNFYVDEVLITTFSPNHITEVQSSFNYDASQVSQTIPTTNDDPNGDQFALR
ncbi:MAG: hypothetical protein RIS53_443, partial [Bacillota bacterium]